MRRRQYLAAATAGIVGTAGCLGDTEYTITAASGTSLSDQLAVTVDVIDGGITVDSNGILTATITNNRTRPVTIRARDVWPFGLLMLEAEKEANVISTTLLQSASYGQTDRVRITNTGVSAENDHVTRSLAAGESKTVSYEIDGGRLTATGTMDIKSYFESYPIVFDYQTASMSTWTSVTQVGTVNISERSLLS